MTFESVERWDAIASVVTRVAEAGMLTILQIYARHGRPHDSEGLLVDDQLKIVMIFVIIF